jgi:phytoene desaturase
MHYNTALVIGAGLAGISTAAHLARSGYQVTVVEKNAAPGGRCGQLVRDGHRYDLGPTMLMMPELYAETYAALGQRMEDHLDLRRFEPTYRLHFDDGAHLDLTADLHTLRSQLEAIEPGSFAGLLRYLVQGHQAFHLVRQHFLGRSFCRALDYFNPQNLRLLFQLKALVRHYDNVGDFFQQPHLKAAFTFQNMYLGISPYDAPATYSLVQYSELADGVWSPTGGMYRVPESLAQIAESHGARFKYNAAVKRIEVDGSHATGVVLEDGTRLTADVIVANADLPYVYRHLLPESAAGRRLERRRYSCSAFMFCWGADKAYPALKTHNVFLASDYRGSFERIFVDHSLHERPSVYVHAPARSDPSAAPPDEDTLMAVVPVGNLDGSAEQGAAAGERLRKLQSLARSAALRRLAEIGITDLEKHLKHEVIYTPQTWLSKFNLTKGAAFGSLSHDVMQLGYLRPSNRHRRYRNLYFAGGSTHPGNGIPLVLISGRLTSERILREVGSPRGVAVGAGKARATVSGSLARERGALHD